VWNRLPEQVEVPRNYFTEEDVPMRQLALVLGAGLLVGVLGCGKTNEVTGEGGKKLKLTVPAMATTVKQGEEAKLTIKVTKEKFDDNVTLKFKDLPQGVKIVEPDTKIPKGGKEATITLKADSKAKVEEGQKVAVVAEAAGMKAQEEFTVNVKENEQP
jgi:hypothetical protein